MTSLHLRSSEIPNRESFGADNGGDQIVPRRLHLFSSPTGKSRRTHGRDDFNKRRGQSLVEFSLVMPMLLITVTGMVAFGIALHDFLVLTNGVNNAAQQVSMSRGQTADPCATAYSALVSAAPSLVRAHLTFKLVVNGASYTAASCTAGASNLVQGVSAQVSATYPCSLGIFGLAVPACSLGSQTSDMIQ